MSEGHYFDLVSRLENEVGDIEVIGNEKKYKDYKIYSHPIDYSQYATKSTLLTKPDNKISICFCSEEYARDIVKRIYLYYIAETIRDKIGFTFDMHDETITFENMLDIYKKFKQCDYDVETASKKKRGYINDLKDKYCVIGEQYTKFTKFNEMLDEMIGTGKLYTIEYELKMLMGKYPADYFPELRKIIEKHAESIQTSMI